MSNGIETKLEKLQHRIVEEKARYISAVRLAVEDLLSAYGLTLLDLALEAQPARSVKVAKGAAKVVKAAAKVVKAKPAKKAAKPIPGNGKGTYPPKYRDPASGATWSGRGHAPSWIKDAANRDEFLIKA
jgi:DNA-binding protein H-NS